MEGDEELESEEEEWKGDVAYSHQVLGLGGRLIGELEG